MLHASLRAKGCPGSADRPPRRIDVLTDITGVDFETAWRSRVSHAVGSMQVPFIGRRELLRNKRAAGRLRDLADVEALESPAAETE